MGVIVITLGIFTAMAVINKDRTDAPFFNNVITSIVSPVQKFFSAIGNKYQEFIDGFVSKDDLIAENKNLNKRILELEEQNRDYTITKNENEQLKKMLDFKEENKDLNLTAARVIAKEQGNWFNQFKIDKGTNDGIENNMAVISDQGVVGYISSAGTTSSLVVSIIDPGSSLGAQVVRSGDITIVEGDTEYLKKGLCKMSYISSNSVVMVGDSIVTSGLGGVYPKGILIGKVKEVTTDVHGISQNATIEPAVNFEKISEVFVVKK